MECLVRWFLSGLATLSLALCLATVVLWIWSYGTTLNLEYQKVTRSARFQVSRGVEHFLAGSSLDGGFAVGPRWRAYVVQPSGNFKDAASYDGVPFLLGFGFSYLRNSTDVATSLYLPCWFTTVLLSMLPVIQFRRWSRLLKAMRLSAGQCVLCGYDLRATPERCPECGTIPKPKEITSS
jgi:hypothetical protein